MDASTAAAVTASDEAGSSLDDVDGVNISSFSATCSMRKKKKLLSPTYEKKKEKIIWERKNREERNKSTAGRKEGQLCASVLVVVPREEQRGYQMFSWDLANRS